MKKTSLTKIVLMWALFLMPTLLVHAQDEEVVATAKPTVFVDKISAGSSSDKLTVLNAVATALTQSGRVIVITSDSERASIFIDQHNSQDDVTAGSDMVAERLAVSMKLGVQYYLAFTVDDIAYSYNSGSASCKITLTGKVIDPKTSSVKGTKQMSFDGSNSDNSQSKAFASAVESITSAKTVLTANPLFQFIEENFPIVCQIVDIDKANKGKAVMVYVNAGTDNGIAKDTKFEVFKQKTVGTRTIQVKIGELSVDEVQAHDLTLCKVSKGGEEIFAEFNGGGTLYVKTRKKVGLLDKIGI